MMQLALVALSWADSVSSVGAVKLATRQVPALAETSVESVFSASVAVAFANFGVLSALWQLVNHKTVRMDYESRWKHQEAARR